jgi:bacterioferritin
MDRRSGFNIRATGAIMGKKGISILKGIEVDEVLGLLNRAYSEEWLAYYQYYVEAKVIKGVMKDSAIKELTEHMEDELRHANMIADRILKLGGSPILHPQEWFKVAKCNYEAPENSGILSVLQQALAGERCAITNYSALAEATNSRDVITYDIVCEILADEVEHEEDIEALIEDIEGFIAQCRG